MRRFIIILTCVLLSSCAYNGGWEFFITSKLHTDDMSCETYTKEGNHYKLFDDEGTLVGEFIYTPKDGMVVTIKRRYR